MDAASPFGSLAPVRALDHPELIAPSVAAALPFVPDALVAPIDPEYTDTAALVEHYGMPLEWSINAVVVKGVRAGVERYAVCLTPADQRVDINGVVRKRLDARKASFAPMEEAVGLTGMEYGGITPVGVPADWPIWVSPAALAVDTVCVGSGLRGSKLFLPGGDLLRLPNAEAVEGLSRPAP